MKRKISVFKIILIIVVLFLTLAIFLFIEIFRLNIKIFNPELDQFKAHLESIPLPEKTSKIGQTYGDFGLLGGNGNHCDYFASMLIQSELSLEELENYYSKYSIPPADPDEILEYTFEKKRGNTPVPIDVAIYPGKMEDQVVLPEGGLSDLYKINPADTADLSEDIYVLSAFDQGYEARYMECN